MREFIFLLIALFLIAGLIALPGFFIHAMVRSALEARVNNKTPFETSTVYVVAKYTEGGDSADSAIPPTYYVTFEDEGGTRRRFTVSSKVYETLKEGDRGALTQQGIAYKGFVRTVSQLQ